MIELNSLCETKIFARLKQKTTFVLMCLATKIDWFFQSTFKIKNLKTQCICCLKLMKARHMICISKISTDLCFKKQRIKTKSGFPRVAYSVVVVKMYWLNIKKFVWTLMVDNL